MDSIKLEVKYQNTNLNRNATKKKNKFEKNLYINYEENYLEKE